MKGTTRLLIGQTRGQAGTRPDSASDREIEQTEKLNRVLKVTARVPAGTHSTLRILLQTGKLNGMLEVTM